MALYQTADGRWGVDFRDEWNTRHRKPVGSQEAAAAVEAQLKEQTVLARNALHRTQRSSDLTLTEARDIYLSQVRATEYTRGHMRDRLALFEKHLGQSQLGQVTPRLLDTWLEKRKETLSPQTLWRDIKMLRAWGEYLKREAHVFSNPFASLQVPKPTETTARAVTYVEETGILAALQPPTRLRMILALDAGLATQEIQRLRKNHVDFAQGVLTSWREKTKRSRTIPLTRRLEGALAEACAGLAPDTSLNSRSGKPLTVKGVTSFLHKARSRMPAWFRFHDLRHTFATRLAASCSNAFVVAELLGHALPRWAYDRQGLPMLLTTRDYVHPPLEELRTAIVEMERRNPNCSPPSCSPPSPCTPTRTNSATLPTSSASATTAEPKE